MSPSNLPFTTPFLIFASILSVLLYVVTRTLFLRFLHPYSLSLSIRLHGVKWVTDNKEVKMGEARSSSSKKVAIRMSQYNTHHTCLCL